MKFEEWAKLNLNATDEILITGASSGIGYEYASECSKLGLKLICISNQSDALLKLKSEFESRYKNTIEIFTIDLSNPSATNDLAEKLANRPIKVLINNAGFGLKGRFESHSAQEYIDIVNVNVLAPVILSRAILPQLQAKNIGLVIHIASINALVPIPNNQVYTATKAFIASYALATARENKNSKIKFQLVLPGTTRTPFHDRQGANPKNLVMLPGDVVKESLQDVNNTICIPNKADRVLAKIIPFLPKNFAMDVAAFLLKKRLGV